MKIDMDLCFALESASVADLGRVSREIQPAVSVKVYVVILD